MFVEVTYAKGEKLYAYGSIFHNRHNFSPSEYIQFAIFSNYSFLYKKV